MSDAQSSSASDSDSCESAASTGSTGAEFFGSPPRLRVHDGDHPAESNGSWLACAAEDDDEFDPSKVPAAPVTFKDLTPQGGKLPGEYCTSIAPFAVSITARVRRGPRQGPD